MTKIHKTAIIEPGAELGIDVEVGPFSVIYSGARIGDGCSLGPHVTVYGATVLGEGSSVHVGAILGDLPQDRKFKPCVSLLKIGKRCVIREGVTLHRGSSEGSATEIGNDCFLMAFSHCGHDVSMGNDVVVANNVLFGGYVKIDDRAFISASCMVHQFCRIGRLAMIGGGGGLSKNVPPFCTTVPMSMNRVGGFNSIGMRRAGIDNAERDEIKRIYRVIYHSSFNTTQALEHIRQTFTSPIAAEISSFIEHSPRGICSWGNDTANESQC